MRSTLFLLATLSGAANGWLPALQVPLRPTTLLPTRRHNRFQTKRRTTVSALSMALVPLPVEELEQLLVTGVPSGPQYATYWGNTKREQYNRSVESALVTVIGLLFSYFLSFVVGSFVATIMGCLFAFWGVLSPELKARQRNWEFLGGRDLVDPWKMFNGAEDKQGLYGSLFLGRIDDVCVVEETDSLTEYDLAGFQDYTMETDELERWQGAPYLIRVRFSDDTGRELQVHGRMSEEYLDIKAGMPCGAILLSTSQAFTTLAALTDVMIPDAECWVGDYPYLNRPEVESLLAEDDELWDLMISQGYEDKRNDSEEYYNVEDDTESFDDEYDDEQVDDEQRDRTKVRLRRRRF